MLGVKTIESKPKLDFVLGIDVFFPKMPFDGLIRENCRHRHCKKISILAGFFLDKACFAGDGENRVRKRCIDLIFFRLMDIICDNAFARWRIKPGYCKGRLRS